ncbi:MAG TPA: glycosyltransferase family A protein [Anaerohalosphaeraceae bacterium]|nr:glycosyltransferase family A protein [Anaerohalosphaeraceae bacterium]
MKISVVIAAYNAAATIERAVRSVLAQTRRADEILVVDDGSRDDTAQIAGQISKSVLVVRQANTGSSVARNTGIEAASGDWIAFLDADDEWLPDKLRLQEAFLDANPELVWGYSNFFAAHSGIISKKAVLPNRISDNDVFDDYLHAYCGGLYAWTGTLLIQKRVFEKTGLFEPGMKRGQDTDLWFRIAYLYPRVGYVSAPLAIYHRDTPNSSTKVNIHYQFMIDHIERHIQLSEQAGRKQAYLASASKMLQDWIRELVEQRQFAQAKDLLTRFEQIVPARFCREIFWRIKLPWAGSLIDFYLKSKDCLKTIGRRRKM